MNPLDEIADWEDIHRINRFMVNNYGELSIYTPFNTIRVPNIFFTERHLVDVMKLRESYIKRLHSLLTKRLPPGATIRIRLEASYSNNIHAQTQAEGMQILNDRVRDIQAGGPNAIRKAELDSINASQISINVRYIGDYQGRPENISYEFSYNIGNPVKLPDLPAWRFMNPRVGADVPDIVYNTVKELKDDASAKVLNVAKALLFRPPESLGPNNLGGPGYRRAKTAFSRNKGGRRIRRTTRRKTLHKKKRYSKKN